MHLTVVSICMQSLYIHHLGPSSWFMHIAFMKYVGQNYVDPTCLSILAYSLTKYSQMSTKLIVTVIWHVLCASLGFLIFLKIGCHWLYIGGPPLESTWPFFVAAYHKVSLCKNRTSNLHYLYLNKSNFVLIYFVRRLL